MYKTVAKQKFLSKIGAGILNTAKVKIDDDYGYVRLYADNPVTPSAAVIEGYFHTEESVKSMAIRKINTTLCGLLGILVIAAFVSYYFAMSSELNLNTLSRQITTLNDENSELQNNLDRLKSFNNVDTKMMQQNLLQKAEKVLEVNAVKPIVNIQNTPAKSTPFNWIIGY